MTLMSNIGLPEHGSLTMTKDQLKVFLNTHGIHGVKSAKAA